MIEAIKALFASAPTMCELDPLDRAILNQLEKRVQRLETWIVLLQQDSAARTPGSQRAIRKDRMRFDSNAVNDALGKL